MCVGAYIHIYALMYTGAHMCVYIHIYALMYAGACMFV